MRRFCSDAIVATRVYQRLICTFVLLDEETGELKDASVMRRVLLYFFFRPFNATFSDVRMNEFYMIDRLLPGILKEAMS